MGQKSKGGSRKSSGFTVLTSNSVRVGVHGDGQTGCEFPSFIPKEIHKIKDPFARNLALRIQRLPVQVGRPGISVMSSCVKPKIQKVTNPVVLLHSFDSSCLEWRCVYPLLEDAGLETWAIDILGWGFCDLERTPPCDAASKRYHLYELWRTHIKRPMILVGPSLGAAVAIDFALYYPEAVHKLVLIDASVYEEGTGILRKLPRAVAYAGVSLLKSLPLRLCANALTFNNISLSTRLDWTNVSRLHCLLPWWEDATVNYMLSGGYNVANYIKQVDKRALIIWGQQDNIISNKLARRLLKDLPNAIMHQIPNCGHLPHVEKPVSVAKLIADFARSPFSVVEDE